jgi:hypothetical protein
MAPSLPRRNMSIHPKNRYRIFETTSRQRHQPGKPHPLRLLAILKYLRRHELIGWYCTSRSVARLDRDIEWR